MAWYIDKGTTNDFWKKYNKNMPGNGTKQ